jgi:N-dimethylarginine dimethylaminohydrolase
MTTHHRHTVNFGPRLVMSATGQLQAAVLVKPSLAIEKAIPLIGEPGAICDRAREQHDVLRKTLEYFGVETTVVEPHGADPLESNAGDAAVVFEDGAALMRLTPLSRRAEADRMEAEFARLDVPLAGHIAAPGLFDGNDVLLAGRTAFVGVGASGNALGRGGFARLAQAHGYRVVEVPLAKGVSALRAVAGAVASDTIVLGADKLDASAFTGFRTIPLERGEEQGAGVLVLGERHVIADIRYRTALAAMRRAGVTVEAIDLYEFTKIGITPSMLALALRRE